MPVLTDTQKRWITYTVLGEANPQNPAEMAGIAATIMNRSVSGRYSSNPAMVALQHTSSGTYQYSTWNSPNNGGNNPTSRFSESSSVYKNALRIVNGVFSGAIADPTGGATHYYSPANMNGVEPYWWSSEAPNGGTQIGGIIFAQKSPQVAAAITAKAASIYGTAGGPGQSTGAAGSSIAETTAAEDAARHLEAQTYIDKNAAESATSRSMMNWAQGNPQTASVPTRSVMSVPIDAQGNPVPPAPTYTPQPVTYDAYSGLSLGTPILHPAPAPTTTPNASGGLEWAGINNFKYDPSNGQGNVALPAGVRPNTTYPGMVNTNFNVIPSASGSTNDNKDQSQLPSSGGSNISGTSTPAMYFDSGSSWWQPATTPTPTPQYVQRTVYDNVPVSPGDAELARARTRNPLGGPDGLSAEDFLPTPVVDPVTHHTVRVARTIMVRVAQPAAPVAPPPVGVGSKVGGFTAVAGPGGSLTNTSGTETYSSHAGGWIASTSGYSSGSSSAGGSLSSPG